nr:hypothetical protein [Tanacetum cinerariifolium]
MCHYYGRFNDALKKEYIEGEICFVDMINREDCKDDILNFVMQSLGYEMDDEVLFYYKIPLKSLDISLKPLVSESDYRSFLGYVQKHKVMHVYVELVKKDKEYNSDSDSDSDSESENEIVDEEHVVDEVEVNMNNFKFQIDEEHESLGNDHIVTNVNVREENLEDKAFRAKAKAQVHLRGDVKVQYALLRDYVCELKRCNPDTTVKIDVYGEKDPKTPTRMFRRIHVCLGALKMRFREGGREFLGLDGTFMRWQYPGQMLKAVGMDANNGIPEDWVHESYKLQTWMNDYSYKIGRPPKKRKKSKGEIAMVKGNKLTRQCKIVTCSLCQAARHNKRSCLSVYSQRNESVPKKTTGTKRISSVTGTSIASTKVGTQASQAGTQTSSGSTFKRTKKYESRLTPEK